MDSFSIDLYTKGGVRIFLASEDGFIYKLHFIVKYLDAEFMACAINHYIAVVAENTNGISRHIWV